MASYKQGLGRWDFHANIYSIYRSITGVVFSSSERGGCRERIGEEDEGMDKGEGRCRGGIEE